MSTNQYKIDTLFKQDKRKVHTQDVPFFNEPINTGLQVVPSDIWSDFADLPVPYSVDPLIEPLVKVVLTAVPGSTISFYDPSRGVVDLIDPLIVDDGSYSVQIYDSVDAEIPSGLNGWDINFISGVVTFSDGVTGIDVSSGITITAKKYIGAKGIGSVDSASIKFNVTMVNHGLTSTDLPRVSRRNSGGLWVFAKASLESSVGTHVIVGVLDSNTVEIAEVGRFNIVGHGLTDSKLYASTQTLNSGELQLSSNVVSGYNNTLVLAEGTDFIHVLPYPPKLIGGEFTDESFSISDNTDTSKQIKFNIDGLSTGETRTIIVPDRNVDLGVIETFSEHLDGNSSKHDASEIDYETVGPNVGVGNVEVAISALDLSLGDLTATPTNYVDPSDTVESHLSSIDTALGNRIPSSEKGQVDGVAELDGAGKIPLSQIPSSIGSGVSRQSFWNASTNTPDLTSLLVEKGYYYVVNVAGSTNLDGITDWQNDDWAIWNGTVWEKVDNSENVSSVNGETGAIILNTDHISEDGSPTNLWFTDARAKSASVLNTLAGTETDQAPSVASVNAKFDGIFNSEVDIPFTPGVALTPVDVDPLLSWTIPGLHSVQLEYTILVKTTNKIKTGKIIILHDTTNADIVDIGYSMDTQDVFVKFSARIDTGVLHLQSEFEGGADQGDYVGKFFNIKPITITS